MRGEISNEYPTDDDWVPHVEEKEAYDPTGAVAYHKCCEMLGIVPVSHFLHNLQAKDAIVSLRHHGLGPKGAKAIAVALTVSLTFLMITA